MFCTNCGKEIDKNADVCVHCGKYVARSPYVPVNYAMGIPVSLPAQGQDENCCKKTEAAKCNLLAILGFIISLFSVLIGVKTAFSAAAVILCGVSLTLVEKHGGKHYALAGVIIGVLSVIWGILSVALDIPLAYYY